MWDVDSDGYGDAESGHGTFIAGLILQVAPAASVYVVKVLDSHGLGDDLTVAKAMEQLPQDIHIVNLSLGGYTDDDTGPLAVANALRIMRKQRGAVVAAAGNAGRARPFWPAAFKQVLGVGSVEQKAGVWSRAPYSNYGWWVDAAARGTNLQSTFAREKTKVEGGPAIAFDGWAAWDGTSFATPIAAAMIARTMSRNGITTAAEAQTHLLASSPAAPQPDFPLAVLFDELEGPARAGLDRRPGNRDPRAAQGDVQPHGAGAQAVEHEPAEVVGLHADGSAPGRSSVTVASPGGSSWPARRRSRGPVSVTSSSIPICGDSNDSCRGPPPLRTSSPASSSGASALSRSSSAISASTVRQPNAARAASSSSCGTGSRWPKIARSSASVVASLSVIPVPSGRWP